MSNDSGPPVDDRGGWETDPLLDLAGSGKDLWADEHAYEYVNRLRAGWEPSPPSG
jgi:hypothetical protein